MPVPPYDKLAHLLVRYSTMVRAGELVSLVASPLAEPLVVALYREVLLAGGHPVVLMTPGACLEALFQLGNDQQLALVSPVETCATDDADVTVFVLTDEEVRRTSGLALNRQALHQEARRPLTESFLRRTAEKSLRWIATLFPCEAAALHAGMTLSQYETILFRAGMLHEDDPASAWRALSQRQARLVDFLQQVRELRLTASAGTDLRLAVAGRTWINGDGRENFPDGEVFTCPIEDATEGIIYFDLPSVHAGLEVQGVRLAFKAGRVIEASADRGEEYLIRLLDQDPGARVLGEIGLGCNYAVTQYTQNTLLDEKTGGTFHLALGTAHPASGGAQPRRPALGPDLRPARRRTDRGGWRGDQRGRSVLECRLAAAWVTAVK